MGEGGVVQTCSKLLKKKTYVKKGVECLPNRSHWKNLKEEALSFDDSVVKPLFLKPSVVDESARESKLEA